MIKYSKLNIVSTIQRWMDSEAGQTFLNYAYSWGAAIVILGTLFKLTHMPTANTLLFIGMGTEVFVFFISAFDRPFEKVPDTTSINSQSATANPHPMPDTEHQPNHRYIVSPSEMKELENANSSLNKINRTYQDLLAKTEETSLLQENINAQLRSTSSNISKIGRIYSSMVNSLKETI